MSSVIRRRLLTASTTSPIVDVVRTMRDERVGSLVILDAAGAPVGIVTQRDIVHRLVGGGLDARTTLARDIMSRPLVTIEASASLEEAAAKMREAGLARLVVVVGSEVRGVVTVRDVAYARPELAERFMDTWVKRRWED